MRDLILTGNLRRSVGTEPGARPPEKVFQRPEQVVRQAEQVVRQPQPELRPPEEAPRQPGQTSPADSGAERRSEPRASAHELVLVKWRDDGGRSYAARARITDRSKKGLGLLMASPPPIHATVAVSGGTSVRGSVQYCTRHDDGYKVGLLRLSS